MGDFYGTVHQVNPDRLDMKTTVSQSGLNVSLLFGKLQAAIGPKRPNLTACADYAFRFPVNLDAHQTLLGFHQTLRGFVGKSAGTRVTIQTLLAGTSKVLEFPFGESQSMESVEKVSDAPVDERNKYLNFTQDVFSYVERLAKDQAPDLFFELPNYEAFILVNIERRTMKDYALALIDSLEVSAIGVNTYRADK